MPANEYIHSFAPICGTSPRCLILGSMPGKASLRAGEYYAFPRNAFWPIMSELLSISPGLDYDQRCQALRQHRVAVWDVLKTCTRTSSLDSDIDPASIVPNDFASLLQSEPTISAVFFNGTTAEQVFRRHVLPDLGDLSVGLQLVRLPSTSPANASWSYERKRGAWQVVGAHLSASMRGTLMGGA